MSHLCEEYKKVLGFPLLSLHPTSVLEVMKTQDRSLNVYLKAMLLGENNVQIFSSYEPEMKTKVSLKPLLCAQYVASLVSLLLGSTACLKKYMWYFH